MLVLWTSSTTSHILPLYILKVFLAHRKHAISLIHQEEIVLFYNRSKLIISELYLVRQLTVNGSLSSYRKLTSPVALLMHNIAVSINFTFLKSTRTQRKKLKTAKKAWAEIQIFTVLSWHTNKNSETDDIGTEASLFRDWYVVLPMIKLQIWKRSSAAIH